MADFLGNSRITCGIRPRKGVELAARAEASLQPCAPVPLDSSTSFIQSIRNSSGFRCELETLPPGREFPSFQTKRTGFRAVRADRIGSRADCDTLTGVLGRDGTLPPWNRRAFQE